MVAREYHSGSRLCLRRVREKQGYSRRSLSPKNVEKSAAAVLEEPKTETPVLSPLHYDMHFNGLDEDTAQRIAGVLDDVVRAARSLMPLDRLDGFTFAEDYESALRGLDRGFEAPPLIATQADYGIGVSMAPIILREGSVKSKIVAHMWIGLGLISEKEDMQKISLHIIVNHLAHVSCTQLLEEILPSFHLSPIEDSFNAFLYPCIANSWISYFGARVSAVFDRL